jgi:Carboxypeptidase regulatory-like domain/Thiol:disulfide interchange protein DsbD, N-terminal
MTSPKFWRYGAKLQFPSWLAILILISTVAFAAETPQLNIAVFDALSGNPTADAEVILTRNGATNQVIANLKTDAAGTCKVRMNSSEPFRIDVRKPGLCPARLEASSYQPGQADSLIKIPLQRTGTIKGTILDDAGKPAAGIRVFFNFPQKITGAHIPSDDLFATSDDEGRFTADFVPDDTEYLQVDLVHPDCAWEESQPSLAQLRDGSAIFKVRRLLVLTGKVLDPDGRPVAGATVVRGEQWGIMGLESGKDTKTDNDGNFRFPSAKSGQILLAAISPRFGPVIKTVDSKSGIDPVELRLTPPHTIRGRVTDLNDKPISGMEVRVSEWGSFRYPPWKFTTDAEGRFTFTNAPADRVQMDFLPAGYMGLRGYSLTAQETEQIVRLGPALRLHGKVMDAQTGKPIPDFKIIPGWPRQEFINGMLTNNGAEWAGDYAKKEFSNGAYDWTFHEPTVAGSQKPYDFMLRVEAEGYGPAISRAFKPTEKDATFDFQLKPAAYLTGSIHLADGSPAVGAKLYLVQRSWDISTMNGTVQNHRQVPAFTTDREGRFKMPDPNEPMKIIVWHDSGFAETSASTLQQTNEIKLTGWGRIEGTLHRGNKIATNEQVALCFPLEYEITTNKTISKPRLFYWYQARTDKDGRFTFEHVTPGEVAISRVESIPRPDRFGITAGEVWGGCRLAMTRLNDGESIKVDVGGFGRTVTGKLVSSNNFENCMVSLTPQLAPVPFPNQLSHEQKLKWAADWFWSEQASDQRIWLGGTPQANLEGKLITQLKPWSVKVMRDGSFEINDVPPGQYTLSAIFRKPSGPDSFNFTELARITHEFHIPAGDRLPEQPALDLGVIGNAPADVQLDAPEPSRLNRVTSAMKPSRETVLAGDTFEIRVRIRIAAGHHIYGTNVVGKPFTPTSIKLTLPDCLEPIGNWSAASASPGGQPDEYTDSVLFTRSLKASPTAPPGPLTIKGELNYQVCNKDFCWPPEKAQLSTAVVLKEKL